MHLHLASHNQKKVAELKAVIAQAGIEGITVVGSEELLGYPEPVENGRTFADNALIKARAGAAATNLLTLADDSGLVVDELGGMPGVYSARWSGKHGDDAANNALLLGQIADVPLSRRTAQFVCVCALVTPDGREWVEKGIWRGRLGKKPVGEHGFGYDPLFIPEEEDQRANQEGERPRTSAELTREEKNRVSHRRRAFTALVPVLKQIVSEHSTSNPKARAD